MSSIPPHNPPDSAGLSGTRLAPAPSGPPGGRRIATAALLAGSVLFSLAIGEAAVRLLRPEFVAGPDPIRNPFWRHDLLLGWSHPPGVEGLFSREEFTHQVRINSAGWRDRERSMEKPPGIFRILVLGDSYTWGHGVEDDRIFTRLLEQRLGEDFEVLNFGLSASATDQQLLILREHALAYQPDLVIVMLSRNDFIGNVARMEGSYPKPMFLLGSDGSLRLTNVPVPEMSQAARLHHRMRRRFGLLNLVESLLESRPETGSGGVAAEQPSPYDVTRALLKAMRVETSKAGAGFAVALAPSNAHTYLDPIPALEETRFRVVRELGVREKVPVLDLVPGFRRAARSNGRVELHYRLDKHWNAAGHEVVARELDRLLRQSELIL